MRGLFHFAPVVAVLFASSSAFGETAEATARATGWTWSGYISIPLFTTLLLYGIGLLRMRQRGAAIQAMPTLSFAAGWISLLVVLDSPMHEISEQLFWVHMTQHEILMLTSAPLLVLSQPVATFLFALPESWRVPVAKIVKISAVKRAWLLISAPPVAWLLHAVALWAWHAPRLFDAALESEPVHAAQHISFFGSALLFWWTLFHRDARRLGHGGAILYVFTTAVHTSALGALLTFAPQVWYAPYLKTAELWNFTALQDQQIGGLVMWVPAGTLLTIVALVLLIKLLSYSQQRWDYTQAAALIRASQGGTQ